MKTPSSQGKFPLSKAVRLLREYHGLKQIETARRLGLSKSIISELESGARPVSLDILHRYAESFEMPMSSVMLLAELQNDTSETPNTIRRVVVSKALKILDWVNERTRVVDE